MFLDAEAPVAIWNYGGIGDHILGLPAVRALADLFAGRLTVISYPGVKELFLSALPLKAVVETETYDRFGQRIRLDRVKEAKANEVLPVRLGSSMWMFDYRNLARTVRGCDLLLSLNPTHSLSGHYLLDTIAPRHSIGFAAEFEVSIPIGKGHRADLIFGVPRLLNSELRIEQYIGQPMVADRYDQKAIGLLGQTLSDSQNLLVLHTDAGVHKAWPSERVSRLLEQFLDRHPRFVAVVVGSRELPLQPSRHADRITSLLPQELPVSLAVVARAELFLGVDSCMLHCADVHRIPGVGLFGPTDDREWGFRFSTHRHIRGDGSMSGIHETEVLNALESVWSSGLKPPK
jgi:ADP-heptose:LPS heptosyltransferase